MTRPKRGRPPLPKGLAKGVRVTIRYSGAELNTLQQLAAQRGLTVTAWLRHWSTIGIEIDTVRDH